MIGSNQYLIHELLLATLIAGIRFELPTQAGVQRVDAQWIDFVLAPRLNRSNRGTGRTSVHGAKGHNTEKTNQVQAIYSWSNRPRLQGVGLNCPQTG